MNTVKCWSILDGFLSIMVIDLLEHVRIVSA